MNLRTYIDIITESNMAALHAEVEAAEAALKAFMKGKPDLANPEVREDYLPIKNRYDEAISALGRAK